MRMLARALAFITAMDGLLVGAQAQAGRSDAVTLSEISVAPEAATAPSPDGSMPIRAAGERGGSVTAPSVARQRAAVNATVGSVAFVDAEGFQDRYASTVRDVLKDVPGIYVQERYGQEARISIRGSGIARGYLLRGLELLQDGIPINNADGSGTLFSIDPLALRSVEVYKGGNALAFGATTLGGAVNFVTPTAHTAFAPNILRVDGGSFGTIRESFQASRISGPADILVNGTLTNSDGYRAHETQRIRTLNANLGYRLAPGVETRFSVGAYGTDQKVPGLLTLDQALKTPRMASENAILGNQSRQIETQRIANRTSFALDSGQLDIDSWAIHTRLYTPIFQVTDQDGWTYGVAPRWAGSFALGGHRNDLLLGLRAFAGTTAADRYVNIAGHRGEQVVNSLRSASSYEAYGENRFWFRPDMALMTGAKLLSSNRTYSDKGGLPNNPDPSFANRTYQGVNPKIGLMWQPSPDIQVFGDVARSRDVPDFIDLTQTSALATTFVPLEAQRAWTWEIGSRGRSGRFAWDVTLYRSEIRDALVNFSVDPGLGLPAATFNAPRSRQNGVEAAVSFEALRDLVGIGDRLSLTQIWTHADFRFVRDPSFGNNRIAGLPPDVLRSVVGYAHPNGFHLSPSVDWVPEGAFADHANTLRAPGYLLFNLQAGIDLPNGVSLFVDARNLAGTRFIADIEVVADAAAFGGASALPVFHPGMGRSLFGGIRAGF